MKKHLLAGLSSVLFPMSIYGLPSSMGSYQRSYLRASASSGDAFKLSNAAHSIAPATPLPENEDQIDVNRGQQVLELVIIDAAVPEKHEIYKQSGPGVEIVELRAGENGLAQLKNILSGYRNLNALHIFSHAEDAKVYLGNSPVTKEVLSKDINTLAVMDRALQDGADVYFYGCNLAKTQEGESFLDLISHAAHVDVAASNNYTGNHELGGDWNLEIQKGDINARPRFDSVAMADFDAVLAFSGTLNLDGMPTGYANSKSYTIGGTSYTVKVQSGAAGGSDLYNYSAGYVYVGTYSSTQTQTSVYFTGGETFSLSSLYLYNSDGSSAKTFRVTSNKGGVQDSASVANFSGTTINFSGANWTDISSFTIQYTDGATLSWIKMDDIVISNLAPPNAAPTATGIPTDVTVTEDTASNFNLSSVTFADADGDSLTVTLTAGAGTFAASSGGSVTIGGSGTGTLTLAGTAANINTYLDTTSNIQYTGAANASGNDATTVTVNANDGTVNPLLGTTNVDITAVNDAPTATGIPTDVTVTEDTASNFNLSAVTFADVDGDSLTVTLAAGAGMFAASSGGGVTVGGSGTGTLTLAGTAANINTYLDTASNIQYTGAANVNGNDATTVTVNANDGTVNPLLGTINVDITAVNDAPTASGIPTDVTVTEDTASNFNLASVTFADVDGDSLTVTLAAGAGTFAASSGGGVTVGGSGTGTLTLAGTAANINTYLDTTSNIQYTGAANASGNDATTVTVNANDGTVNPLLGTINVDITAVNDAPTATGIPTDVTVTEDTASNFNLSSITFTDVDGDSLTVTLTAGAGTFAASSGGGVTVGGSGTGTLTLAGTAANINTYLDTTSNIQYTGALNASGNDATTVTVNASDGTVNPLLGTINVDITAVNDAPTATGIPTDVTVTEDTASNFNLASVTFADVDGDSLTVTLTAGAGTFAAASGGGVTVGGSGTGTLTLAGAAANINTYLDTASNIQYTGAANVNGNDATTVTVNANDGTVNPLLGTINVDITAVNDAPTATGIPTDVTVTEETASNFNLASVTFADVDGDSLTVTLTAGAGTFAAASGGGVTVGGSGTGTLTLAGTAANINTYLDTASNIQYTGALNASGNNATTVTVNANDGTVNPLLGTINVDITAVNDAPTASGIPTDVTVAEDTASNFNLASVTFADVDGDSLTVTLTAGAGTFAATSGGGVTVGGSGTGTLTLAGTAANINTYLDTTSNIQYTGAANANGNDATTVTVNANDGTVNPLLGTINVDITAVNDAPTATGIPTDITVTEDTAGNFNLSSVTFADGDGDSLTLTLAAGAGTFSATSGGGVTVGGSGTGTLTLAGTAANINTYLDTVSNIQYTGALNANGNDVTTVTINANDGTVSPLLGTINVDITAVNDPSTDISLDSTTINQADGINGTVGNLSTTDVDDSSFTYTLVAGAGDTDNASFNISGSQLRANDASAMTPGSYSVRVNSNDGVNDFAKTFTITVFEATDTDGDGVSDFQEGIDGTDPNDPNDYKDVTVPVVTAPADLVIDATGLYTTVTLRQLLGLAANATDTQVQQAQDALAIDNIDGADCCGTTAVTVASNGGAAKPISGNSSRLAPGNHVVTWRATDRKGNNGTDTQTVQIRPLVSLSKDQVGVEGGSVTFKVLLNGPALSYPYDVPFTIDAASTATGADHDLVAGNATINAGLSATVTVNLFDDGAGDDGETLIVNLDTGSVNAGVNTQHTITITENNVAPDVTLTVQQNAINTSLVITGDGNVTVNANVTDPNAGDTHTYDWSGTSSQLMDTDGDPADATLIFDPSGLTPGVYTLDVFVTDNNASDSQRLRFRVVDQAPVLGTTDSDGDGPDDQTEGFGDSDGDGIPEYLDNISNDNVLPESAGVTDAYLIECDPGTLCRLGQFALLGADGGAQLTVDDITAQADLPADDAFDNVGGIFDFEARDLPIAGQNVRVVIPQTAAVPADAVYRKFANDQWFTFVEDANNALHSAPGEAGFCPPPGDASWEPGLVAGYFCVQLTVEDGGPNDADGLANGSVEDPGGVGTAIPTSSSSSSGGSSGSSSSSSGGATTWTIRGKTKSGGGSLDMLGGLALLLLVLFRHRRRAIGLLALVAVLFAPLLHAQDGMPGDEDSAAVESSAGEPADESEHWWQRFQGNSYLALGLYQAEGDQQRGDFVSGMAGDGVTVNVQEYDVSRSAYQLSLGYRYLPGLAVELGYLDLGDADFAFTATATDAATVNNALSKHLPVSSDGWVIANRFDYQFGNWRASADLGLYIWDGKAAIDDPAINADIKDGTDPLLGLSIAYPLPAQLELALQYRRILFDDQNVELWGAALSWDF